MGPWNGGLAFIQRCHDSAVEEVATVVVDRVVELAEEVTEGVPIPQEPVYDVVAESKLPPALNDNPKTCIPVGNPREEPRIVRCAFMGRVLRHQVVESSVMILAPGQIPRPNNDLL
jgi:hypothetical protein